MTDVEIIYAPPRTAQLERLTPEQIRYIANTDIIPKALRGNPEKIMATILKGRSLGLDDISSLSAIHVIEGKAGLSAETMVHLVRKAGHSVVWEAKPAESCTVVGTRRDNKDTGAVTWTIVMAKEAGLSSKDVWKRYPDAMLWSRAVSQLCRMLFADVLMGTSYSPEELEEVAERGRVTEAVSDLPGVEEAQIRTEPQSAPSEAMLNRLAHLEERAGSGALITLRGVFGVEMASELSAADAARYEAMLELGLPPEDSGQGAVSDSDASSDVRSESGAGEAPRGDGAPTPAATTAEEPSGNDSVTDGVSEAVGEAGTDASEAEPSSADELPGEPAPEPETDERLVELAGETEIPIGNYRGMKLSEIHEGWIDYSLQPANTARLPEPFVEALELWARTQKPELWKKWRSDA